MIHEISQISQWLAGTPASAVIQRSFWVVPTVQTLHLVAISVVVASGALLGGRLLGGAGGAPSIAETARRVVPWIWRALAVLAATGAVLIVGEPARTLGNPSFWAKGVAIALAVALTLWLQRRLRADPRAWTRGDSGAPSPAARWLGAGTLALWVSAVAFGRWIAYVLEA